MSKRTRQQSLTPTDLIRLYLLREKARQRLNVPGFAKAIGVSSATVNHWLHARRGIGDEHWQKIATFFDLSTPEALLIAAREAATAQHG